MICLSLFSTAVTNQLTDLNFALSENTVRHLQNLTTDSTTSDEELINENDMYLNKSHFVYDAN